MKSDSQNKNKIRSGSSKQLKPALPILLFAAAMLTASCVGSGTSGIRQTASTDTASHSTAESQESSSSTTSSMTSQITDVIGQTASVILISAAKGREMLDEQPDIFLLDVRTEMEYDAGYIEGAYLLPYDEIPRRLNDLPADKETPIIVYCRSGRRSAIAADLLTEAGYRHVYDMGGINSWPYGLVQG